MSQSELHVHWGFVVVPRLSRQIYGSPILTSDTIQFSASSETGSQILSNFYPDEIKVDDILSSKDSYKIKELANELVCDDIWEHSKTEEMFALIKARGEQSVDFRDYLLSTDDKPLLHNVGDPFWGKGTSEEPGLNVMGNMLQSLRASMLVASDVPQDAKPHMQPSPTLTKVKAIIQSPLKIISKWRKPSPKTTISSPKQTPNDTVVLGSDSFVDKFDEDGDRPPNHTVSCDDVTLVKEPVTVAPTSTEDMVYVDSTTGQVTIRSTNNTFTQHVVPQPTSVVNNTHAIPQPSNVNNNITKVDRGYTEFTGWINETHDVINTVESNILTEIRSLKDNNQRCINNLQSKVDSMLDGNPRVVQSNSHTDHVRISDSSPTSSSSHVSDNQQPSSHDPNRRRDKPSIILLTDSTGKHINNDLFLGDTKTAIRRMFKDLRLDLRSWLPDIDQLRGWTELIKSPRADRPKGFGSALSFPEADLWQAAMSENQSQILL